MKISTLFGKKRQCNVGCSLGRLLFFAVILIVMQVSIVFYQMFVWSRMRCVDPMKCSKVLFANWMDSNENTLLNVQEIHSRFENDPRPEPSTEMTKQDHVLDCGINGRKKHTNVKGSVNLHEWYGWCGYTTDDLRRDPNFPRNPKVRKTLTELSVVREKYKMFGGKRMFGYLHPPRTGLYQFFISSEDSSDLWLSSDDEPRNTRMIAYLGEAPNQYGERSKQGEYFKFSSQRSANISLIEGRAYFFEMYQKKKEPYAHMQVAWKIPGSSGISVIGSQFISQYLDESSFTPGEISKREACITKNVPGLDFRFNKYFHIQNSDFVDDFFIKAPRIPDADLDPVLPICSYKPSYLTIPLKKQFDSQKFIISTRVYPNDRSDVYKNDGDLHEISIGNRIIPEKEAKSVVSRYMNALKERTGNKYHVNGIALIEAKYDINGSVRYFMELDVKENHSDKSLRLSRHLYSPSRRTDSKLCYPDGYIWQSQTPIYMIVTVMNYGYWIKDLISQLDKFYKDGIDRNFYLTIIDFNSTDINLKDLIEKSALRQRCTILKKDPPFWKTHGLNEGARLVKNPNSIIFTIDLHLTLPANIFDAIRKHTIKGKTVYTPKVLKLKCGFSPVYAQGSWDFFGYGLFGAYKSDWDRIGGMDEEQFRHKWGGEDVDLMDRVLKAKLDVERVCLPRLYHSFHTRDQDWYEDARI